MGLKNTNKEKIATIANMNTRPQHRRRMKDNIDDEQNHNTSNQYDDSNDDLLEELLLSSSSSSSSSSCSNNERFSLSSTTTGINPNEIGNKRKMTHQPATASSGVKAKGSLLREMLLAACIFMVIWAYGYNRILSSSSATDNALSNIITRINNNNIGNNGNSSIKSSSTIKVSSLSSPTRVEGEGDSVSMKENNTTTDDGTSQFYESSTTNTDDTDISLIDDLLPMLNGKDGNTNTDDYDTLVDDMINLSSSSNKTKNDTNGDTTETIETSRRSSTTVPYDDSNIIETVEIPWYDLRYRRICTNVGLYSILCMTVRFPFQYAAPDDKSTTRRPILPVPDEFYQLDKSNMHHIRYQEWMKCSNNANFNSNSTTNPLIIKSLEDTIIRKCLYETAYEVARKRPDNQEPVVTFWTRERRIPATATIPASSTIYFHGTGHIDAVNRIYQFFGPDHELIVMGASPAPGVTEGLHELLGSTNCQRTFVHKRPNYNCINQPIDDINKIENNSRYLRQHHQRNRNKVPAQQVDGRRLDAITREFDLPFSTLNESQINIGIIDYRSVGRNGQHELPKRTVVEHLKVLKRQPGWTTLRNFTLFVEYPMAHIQTQDMIQKNIEKVYELQSRLPSLFMDVQSPSGKKKLKKQGYEVQNIIAFDGLPQFYPTATSGWATTMYFLSTEGFKIPVVTTTSYNITPVAYANICVGPLPKNSLLREINLLNRRRFRELGINPQFYGRTWEFVNLFWWQMKMYDGKGPGEAGLDCTHTSAYDGINGIHRFFVQAMVDDYFENE